MEIFAIIYELVTVRLVVVIETVRNVVALPVQNNIWNKQYKNAFLYFFVILHRKNNVPYTFYNAWCTRISF